MMAKIECVVLELAYLIANFVLWGLIMGIIIVLAQSVLKGLIVALLEVISIFLVLIVDLELIMIKKGLLFAKIAVVIFIVLQGLLSLYNMKQYLEIQLNSLTNTKQIKI